MANHFEKNFFAFHRQLKRNNNREWFHANKEKYESTIKKPALDFIAQLAPEMKKISPHVSALAKSQGGSLFRIYRDMRFDQDGKPYKTHTSMHFPIKTIKASRSESVHTPGFYLHFEPGKSFCAAGIWHPQGDGIVKIRRAILENPKEWSKAKKGLELGGESLKTNPRGFDPEHPLIEDLRRKDFITSFTLSDAEICSPKFFKTFLSYCKKSAPLMGFLAKALNLPW